MWASLPLSCLSIGERMPYRFGRSVDSRSVDCLNMQGFGKRLDVEDMPMGRRNRVGVIATKLRDGDRLVDISFVGRSSGDCLIHITSCILPQIYHLINTFPSSGASIINGFRPSNRGQILLLSSRVIRTVLSTSASWVAPKSKTLKTLSVPFKAPSSLTPPLCPVKLQTIVDYGYVLIVQVARITCQVDDCVTMIT